MHILYNKIINYRIKTKEESVEENANAKDT
jgi:hypothetical protein